VNSFKPMLKAQGVHRNTNSELDPTRHLEGVSTPGLANHAALAAPLP